MRSFFSHVLVKILAVFVALIVIGVFVVAVMTEKAARELKGRPDKGFTELNLPPSYQTVAVQSKIHSGDLITSSLVAQARTYRVSMNMEQSKNSLVEILNREQDTNANADASHGDARLSMHPEARSYQLAGSAKTCSPIEVPLKSNTFATVIFGDTPASVSVALDEDGKVDTGAAGELDLQKFVRPSCATAGAESYATIVIWAM